MMRTPPRSGHELDNIREEDDEKGDDKLPLHVVFEENGNCDLDRNPRKGPPCPQHCSGCPPTAAATKCTNWQEDAKFFSGGCGSGKASCQVHPSAKTFVYRAPALESQEYKERVKKARAQMLQTLISRLKLKCGNGTSNCPPINCNQSGGPSAPPAILKTAKTLEHLLFEQSKQNLSIFQDRSTLEQRLRTIQMILVRRKMMQSNQATAAAPTQSSSSAPSLISNIALQSKAMRKQKSPSTVSATASSPLAGTAMVGAASVAAGPVTSPSYRSSQPSLKLTLGKELYERIKSLVEEIEKRKTIKVAAFCGTQACRNLYSKASFTDPHLPQVVRRFFFGMTLMDQWKKSANARPIHNKNNTNNVTATTTVDHWKRLYEQAKQNLDDYLLWEQEQEREQQEN